MNRRRLAIEPWRDAMLHVARNLDLRLGGPAVKLDAQPPRRTIYARIERRDLDPLLRLYDFPPPTAHNPGRTATTTPLQQLFVLNGDFFQQQAARLVELVLRDEADREERVQRLYEILFQRSASAEELRLARAFLDVETSVKSPPGAQHQRWVEYCHVLLGSNEFMFVD
jgi:hypothetical protein